MERIFSLLPPLFSPPCPLVSLLSLLNLSYVTKDAVPIDANVVLWPHIEVSVASEYLWGRLSLEQDKSSAIAQCGTRLE